MQPELISGLTYRSWKLEATGSTARKARERRCIPGDAVCGSDVVAVQVVLNLESTGTVGRDEICGANGAEKRRSEERSVREDASVRLTTADAGHGGGGTSTARGRQSDGSVEQTEHGGKLGEDGSGKHRVGRRRRTKNEVK